MPCLSDPGPLNVRRPHPHRVQPTETGCRNVEPSRKEDHGKDCMYRGAELAAAPRTGGTPLRPCPTSGTPFGSTTGRRVIGQRGGCRALNNTKRTLQSYRDQERFPARGWATNSTTDAGTSPHGFPAKPFKRDSHATGLSQRSERRGTTLVHTTGRCGAHAAADSPLLRRGNRTAETKTLNR